MRDERKGESEEKIWEERADKNRAGDILNESKLSHQDTLISQSADSTLSQLALKTARIINK